MKMGPLQWVQSSWLSWHEVKYRYQILNLQILWASLQVSASLKVDASFIKENCWHLRPSKNDQGSWLRSSRTRMPWRWTGSYSVDISFKESASRYVQSIKCFICFFVQATLTRMNKYSCCAPKHLYIYSLFLLFSIFLQGDDCQLKHVQGYNDLIKLSCKFYIQGFCLKGDSCPYMHNILSPFYGCMAQNWSYSNLFKIHGFQNCIDIFKCNITCTTQVS